jgi:hypothetical protein
MAERVPFGFRRDVEEKPEVPAEAQREISNTTCSTQTVWTPVVRTPATPR